MRIAVARRNALANNFAAALNSGYIRVYSGTRPTNADTALSGNTLLAEMTFGATAYGSASSGVITANAIAATVGAATGTATFVRLFQSNGTTAEADLSVSLSGGGGECILSTLSITQGLAISVTSCSHSFPVGT